MRRRTSPFRVGLFALACVTILVGGLIWVGIARFFEEQVRYVCYFDESVEGLHEDAKVSYRGVRIGHVASIQLAPDGRLVEVEIDLSREFEVDRTIAASIAQEGFTGQRYLAIDDAPPGEPILAPDVEFAVGYPVIPTRPSTYTRIETGIARIVEEVDRADIPGLIEGWKEAGRSLEEVLGDPALQTALARLGEAAGSLERILARIEASGLTEDLPRRIEEVSTAWRQAALDLDRLLTDPALDETIENLRRTSSDLAGVSSDLRRGTAGRDWGRTFDDVSGAAGSARRASEALAERLEAVPPDAFVRFTDRGDRLLVSLEGTLRQMNRVLAQLELLARNLGRNPGRILSRPTSDEEPFDR